MPEIVQSRFKKIPWDTEVLGLNTYEITDISVQGITDAIQIPGLHTIKVNPLFSKQILHEKGFYYCDTLVEPFCRANSLICHENKSVSLAKNVVLEKIEPMARNTWQYDRFHRDFNIDPKRADERYINWLRQLAKSNNILTLKFKDEIACFFGFNHNKIVLHAIDQKFKGRGLAKFFWSAACTELFQRGYEELTSSISLANTPALNLYISLGFKMRNPQDVYHCLVKEIPDF